jgi:hypothetical protein
MLHPRGGPAALARHDRQPRSGTLVNERVLEARALLAVPHAYSRNKRGENLGPKHQAKMLLSGANWRGVLLALADMPGYC